MCCRPPPSERTACLPGVHTSHLRREMLVQTRWRASTVSDPIEHASAFGFALSGTEDTGAHRWLQRLKCPQRSKPLGAALGQPAHTIGSMVSSSARRGRRPEFWICTDHTGARVGDCCSRTGNTLCCSEVSIQDICTRESQCKCLSKVPPTEKDAVPSCTVRAQGVMNWCASGLRTASVSIRHTEVNCCAFRPLDDWPVLNHIACASL